MELLIISIWIIVEYRYYDFVFTLGTSILWADTFPGPDLWQREELPPHRHARPQSRSD